MATYGTDPFTGQPRNQGTTPAPSAGPVNASWQAPDDDLGAWGSVSSDIGGVLKNLGLSEEQGYNQWVAAGRPRGAAARAWKASLTSPAATELPQVAAPEAGTGSTEMVRRAAGLPGNPRDANSTVSLAPTGPDPVQQAITDLQNSGAAGRQLQMDALTGMQTAGEQEAQQQQGLISQLQGLASGQTMGAAEMLFRRALGQQIAAQQASAAGIRGGSAAAASRNAGLLGNQTMSESRDTASALRMQEQAQAQGLLGTTLAQSRAGDVDRAANIADISAQVRGMDSATAAQVAGLVQANAVLEEQKRQAATGTALSLLQTDLNAQSTNLQALLQKAGLSAQYDLGQGNLELGRDQLRAQKEQATQQFWAQMVGNVLGGASAFGSAMIGAPKAPGAQASAAGFSNGFGTNTNPSNPASDAYWGI
jgi:hypothetical protein